MCEKEPRSDVTTDAEWGVVGGREVSPLPLKVPVLPPPLSLNPYPSSISVVSSGFILSYYKVCEMNAQFIAEQYVML